jgi:hypothetical protein
MCIRDRVYHCHLCTEMRPYLPHKKSHPKVAFLFQTTEVV